MAWFSCAILLLIFFWGNEIFAKEIFTNAWAVKVRGSFREAEELAVKYGFSYHKHLFQDYHVFKRPELKKKSGKSRLSSEIDRKLELEPKVEWFMHQRKKKYQLFSRSFTDPRFKEQWYIKRPAGSNEPTYNIISAWEAGYTGNGILVAVVDDGVDGSLAELSPNYNLTLSYDYVDDVDVKPFEKKGTGHGSSCAGVIAGVADNGVCGVGLAYKAKITGIRLFDQDIESTDAWESKALVHKLENIDIYSNSWGPGDMAWEVEGPGPLTTEAIKHGIEKGRGGLGAIYTFAAGNGGITGDSCAYNGYVNSIYTIAINGVNQDGSNPSYAEECPGIMASAYSRDSIKRIGKIITVDSEKCVDDFGASSAATAMASGLIALTLQANRNLTWRDVQHIIAYSARHAPGGVPLKRGHWLRNKAGLYVSKFYGFGLMDAGMMVSLAKNWTTVPPQLKCEMNGSDTNKPIPSTVSITFSNCKIKFLEHVQVRVNLDFSRRGDLSLQLKAPSSTTSPLTRKRSIDNLTRYTNLKDWVITTLFHWGEDPTGKWELVIEDFDKRIPSTGKLYNWSLILYGTTLHPRENVTRENVTREIFPRENVTRENVTRENVTRENVTRENVTPVQTIPTTPSTEATTTVTTPTRPPTTTPGSVTVSWWKYLLIAVLLLCLIVTIALIMRCLWCWWRQRKRLKEIRRARLEKESEQTEQELREVNEKHEYTLLKENSGIHKYTMRVYEEPHPLSPNLSTWT